MNGKVAFQLSNFILLMVEGTREFANKKDHILYMIRV